MPLHFREDRATQAAARLLKLRGGKMSYLKLLKLLYLADRSALLQLGRPITFDRFVSMPHGPVLSRTYDLIVSQPDPNEPSYWNRIISEHDANYEVRLLTRDDIPNGKLSRAEERILDEVFAEFGSMNRWQIRDYSHTLPEWTDPDGGSLPIDLHDILIEGGIDEEQARAMEDAIAAEDALHQIAG